MEPMLRTKAISMGAADAIEMFVRDMGMSPRDAMMELARLLDGGEGHIHVLEEGDWEYAPPDEGVCTFSPT